MEKNKGLVVSVIVLLIAVLLLGGYIIYDKFFDNKSDNKVITEKIIKDNKSEMKYEISNIKGYYTYENGKNTSESEYEKYELTLLDNGLFVYTLENVTSNTIIGNYYIDGNNIILNYLYDSGIIGGPSLLTISGSRTINVSGDNLIDNNRSIGDDYIYFDTGEEPKSNVKKIILSKSNETAPYTSESLSKYLTSGDTDLLNSSSKRP